MATTITTIKKSKIGQQDINFDVDGSLSEFSVPTSDGSTRSVKKVNASHIPSTTTTRALTRIGTGTPASSATDVDGHLQEVYADLAKIGEPDGTSVEVSSGILQIKALGVDTAEIAADAVTNAKLGTSAVVGSGSGASGDNVIQAATIGTTELGADCVDGTKIADNAIDSEHYTDGSIDNEHHADGSIKAAKMADTRTHFIVEAGSTDDTGTGTTFDITTVATVTSSDIITASVRSLGTGNNYIESVANNGGNIRVTYDSSQSSGTTTVDWVILRAVTA